MARSHARPHVPAPPRRAANPGGGDGPVAAPRMRTAPRGPAPAASRGLARSCQGRGACGRAAQRRHARNRSPDSRGHPRLHGPQRAAPPPGCPAPSLARFLQTPPPSENGTQGAPHSRSPSGGPAPGSTAPWRPAGCRRSRGAPSSLDMSHSVDALSLSNPPPLRISRHRCHLGLVHPF